MTNTRRDRYTDKEYSEIIHHLYALHDYVSVDLLYEITGIDREIIENILVDINELLSIRKGSSVYIKIEKSHLADVINSKSNDKIKQIDKKILDIHKRIDGNYNIVVSQEYREYINKNCYYHILNNYDSEYISTSLLDNMKQNPNIGVKDYSNLLNTFQRTSFDYYTKKEYDKLIELNKTKVKFVEYLLNRFENDRNVESLKAAIDYYPNDKAITILFDMICSMEYNNDTAEEIEEYKIILEKKINNITDYNLRSIFNNIYSLITNIEREKPKNLFFGTSILMGMSFRGFQDIVQILKNDMLYDYHYIDVPKSKKINDIILTYDYLDDGLQTYLSNNDDITSVDIALKEAFFDNFSLEYIIERTVSIIFESVYKTIYDNSGAIDTSELDEYFNDNICDNFCKLYDKNEIESSFLTARIIKMYNDDKIDRDFFIDDLDLDVIELWRNKMYADLQEALFRIWLAQAYMNNVNVMDVIDHKYATYDALIFAVVFNSIYNCFQFDKFYNYVVSNISRTDELDFQKYMYLLNTHFYIRAHIYTTDTSILQKQIGKTFSLANCITLKKQGDYAYLISLFNNKSVSIKIKIKELRNFYKDSRYICDCNICRCQERLDGYFMDAAVSHLTEVLYYSYKDSIMELISELARIDDCVIECRKNYEEEAEFTEEVEFVNTSCLDAFQDILIDLNEEMWQILKNGNSNPDIKFCGKKAEWIRILNNLVGKENLLQSEEFLDLYYLMGRYNIFNVNYFVNTAYRPEGYNKCLEQYIIGNLDYVIDNNCDVTIRQLVSLGKALSTTEIINNKTVVRKYIEIIKTIGYRPIGKNLLEAEIRFSDVISEYNLYSVIKSSYNKLSDFKFADIKLIYDYLDRLDYSYYNYLTDIFEVIIKYLFIYTDDADAKRVRLKYALNEFSNNYSEAFAYNTGFFDYFNSIEAIFAKTLLVDYANYYTVLDIIDESKIKTIQQEKIKKVVIYYTLKYHDFYNTDSSFITFDVDKSYYDLLLTEQLGMIENSKSNGQIKEQDLKNNCLSILGSHDCSIKLLKKCISILENID